MKQLILLNGPMNCGKSFAVNYLKSVLNTALVERQCKDKLHELTMSIFNVPTERYWNVYTDKMLKELPLNDFRLTVPAYNLLMDRLHGVDAEPYYQKTHFHENNDERLVDISIRQAMIYVSECLMKPTFGHDYFGLARINSMEDSEIAIDDSAGFEEELYPAIEKIGQDNILLLRVHGRGEFAVNDSRSFIPDGVIDNTVDIDNSDDSEEGLARYLELVTNTVNCFLDGNKIAYVPSVLSKTS